MTQGGPASVGPGGEWFAGETAMVTGAARGIGHGIAQLLDRLGAQVIAVDRDGPALEEAFGHGPVVCCHRDLADEGAEQFAEEMWGLHGPIDLLVNNVGVDTHHRFLELGEPEFDRVFDTNLRGPWFLTKGVTGRMVSEQRSGAVVFVSSLHDTFVRTFPHYSASKAAVAMLVRELASELAPSGIRVNAVSPGMVRSAQNRFAGVAEEESMSRRIPLGRIGEPDDVARLVAVLLSSEWAGYVTGANIPVDGGLALHSWATSDGAPAPEGLLMQGARRLKRSWGQS